MTPKEQLLRDQALIEGALSTYFVGDVPYSTLYDAMRYSLMAGGKRVRPVLVLEACRACGGQIEGALDYACALEMVHTYSLIHDDLPCMDNDDFRRGRPTNHKVYGEDMATLAGDGLLTAAFAVITGARNRQLQSPQQLVDAVEALATAAGEDGMVAGQVLDLQWEAMDNLSREQLELIHSYKTGALLQCAVELGCIAAGGDEEQKKALQSYAAKLGMAFQIRDDILDVIGSQEELGKPIGSDEENRKVTFVTLMGIEESQRLVEQLSRQAQEAIQALPNGQFLRWLAEELAGRTK